MLSAPTRPSTPGSATPSAWTPRPPSSGCWPRCTGQGYDIGPFDGPDALPGVADLDGDALVHALIAAGGQDEDWLTVGAAERQPGAHPGRRRTARCFDTLPAELRDGDGASTGARRPARCSWTHATTAIVLRRAAGRQRRGDGAAAARLRREPDRDLPRPGPAARRTTTWPRTGGCGRCSARTRSCTWASTATSSGCPARPSGCPPACGPDAAHRRPAADLPVPGQRPGRGHPGQAPRARHAGRPPGAADGPRRVLRRHRPAGAAARRARQHRRDGPGEAAGRSARRSGR